MCPPQCRLGCIDRGTGSFDVILSDPAQLSHNSSLLLPGGSCSLDCLLKTTRYQDGQAHLDQPCFEQRTASTKSIRNRCWTRSKKVKCIDWCHATLCDHHIQSTLWNAIQGLRSEQGIPGVVSSFPAGIADNRRVGSRVFRPRTSPRDGLPRLFCDRLGAAKMVLGVGLHKVRLDRC